MFLEAIIKSKSQLLGSLIVTLFAIFVSSICMYMVESDYNLNNLEVSLEPCGGLWQL